MKRILIWGLTALMLSGFVGCKRNVPGDAPAAADAQKAEAGADANAACASIQLTDPVTNADDAIKVLSVFFTKFDGFAKDAVKADGNPDCDKFGDALLAHLKDCTNNLKLVFDYLSKLDSNAPEVVKMRKALQEDMKQSEAYLKTQEKCSDNDKVIAFASGLLAIMAPDAGKASADKAAAGNADKAAAGNADNAAAGDGTGK